MKTIATFNLRKKRLVVLLSAIGFASAGLQAQENTGNDRSKMVDRSKVTALDYPSSSEREAPEFDKLAPSALGIAERRIMLETAAPLGNSQQSVTLEDRTDNANFASGRAILLAPATQSLDALLARLKGKTNIHFQIVGHTDNQPIAAALRPTFADNQALSEARALSVAAYIKERLQLKADAFAVSGLGDTIPVADNDTPAGMAKNRRTSLRVWFDEPVATAPAPAPRQTRKLVSTDPCAPVNVKTGLPFSISIDGKPLDTDTVQQEADRQRCVDVGLEKASVQIKYDPLNVLPALNVWTTQNATLRGKPITFATYTNYAWWLRRAEVRVFAKDQSTQQTPLAVLPLAIGGNVQWQTPDNLPAELGFVLRVYDEQGRFDETVVKPLRLLERDVAISDKERKERNTLSGWGESTLTLKNIPASGGTVTVSGDKVKTGDSVTALGMSVPVDAKGKFVMRQILPAGPHSVEVSIKDAQGVGASFKRNLSIADKDWFYVAVADLTVGHDRTSGPAPIVTADSTHYNNQTWVDGRGAFYLKGKIKGEYLLTASADTQEQPLKNLFTNFQSKDPYYLLRSIDPNLYYPVYGDDSTITDDAPTQGKFYVKLEKDGSYAMWGNFQTAWTGTELTQFTRGLYGANVVWQSKESTTFGEKTTSVNVFAAEPGTLQSREEFRGTGGSLYYLRRQDLTQGSERLWVEIRDRDSGLVMQRSLLTPAQDYDIDYLQGRLTLRAPLPSVADGSTLVQTSSLNGNPVYLVATYEYVPGLTDVSGTAVGLRASHWFGDGVRLGVSTYHQGTDGAEQNLKGVDAMFRYKPGTWVKAEVARSSGTGTTTLTSLTGGFDFAQNVATGQRADAKRIDVAVDFAELSETVKGHLSAYWQERDAGFSGPGLVTPNGEAMRQSGIAAAVPIGDQTELALKMDDRLAPSQTAHSAEVAIRHKINPEWGISAGVRHDQRDNPNVAGLVLNASPLLSQNGGRTDVIVRVDFTPLRAGEADKAQTAPAAIAPTAAMPSAAPQPQGSILPAATANNGPASTLVPGISNGAPAVAAAGIAAAHVPGLRYESWDMYGFVQQTLSRTGDRSDNDRAGVGGSWQVSDRLRIGLEGSGGSGGAGGKISGDYQVDNRSNLYLSYGLETDIQDSNYSGRQGTLTAGAHYRLSDQIGLFGETRWVNGDGPQSLTHAFGVDLAPNDRWTTGLKFETGTLSDPVAGDLKRNAIGLSAAYKYENLKVATALEYRTDRGTSLGTALGTCTGPDLTSTCTNPAGSNDRRTWLFKSGLGYQIDPAWRLLGKFNLSRSTSSDGAFYDGDYTEFVLGTAYRPVDNDRWNTLFKYTYFYNLPSPGQIDSVTGSPLDYTQKSHILDIDTNYDVRPWLTLGAKYGVRLGQLQASKTDGDWFSSRADLIVLRADLHWIKEWDALIEARRLHAREAGDARSGYLLGIYRHFGEHAKLGFGYNFTNFSDDLTDMSYRSKGWFLNALSTF